MSQVTRAQTGIFNREHYKKKKLFGFLISIGIVLFFFVNEQRYEAA